MRSCSMSRKFSAINVIDCRMSSSKDTTALGGWGVVGLVFQKDFQKFAPDILIKYLEYKTNIPKVIMCFEHV